MNTYYGGEPVKEGFYMNRATLRFEAIGKGGGILPGSRFVRYRKMGLPAVMTAGPLVGLAYVSVLPAAALFALVYLGFRRAARRLRLQRAGGDLRQLKY